MRKTLEIDWLECPGIEVIPGKQGGVPLTRGTRIPAQQIVDEYELGSPVDEIAENYPSITREQIESLITFALKQQPVQG